MNIINSNKVQKIAVRITVVVFTKEIFRIIIRIKIKIIKMKFNIKNIRITDFLKKLIVAKFKVKVKIKITVKPNRLKMNMIFQIQMKIVKM